MGVVALSEPQKRMAQVVRRMDLGLGCRIPVGPAEKDAFGKQLDLDPRKYAHLFSADGKQVSQRVKDYLHRLQNDKAYRDEVNAAIMNYDVRIYDAPEEFWVAVALTYAKNLMDSTGERDGHTIHLGKDAYSRHGKILEIFAYTLLKTGVCNNGGGIINWGTVDGGTMKSAGNMERATTGRAGNWGYGTVSHKGEEATLAGIKFGVDGKVVCVENLVEILFLPMLTANTLGQDVIIPLNGTGDPQEHITYVGDLAEFQAHLAHRMIGARTTMDPIKVAVEDALAGVRIAIPTDGSPLVTRIADVAERLGAIVRRSFTVGGPCEPAMARDPNEPKSYGVRSLLDAIKYLEEGTRFLYVDPDGDRGAIIDLDRSTALSQNIVGTDLFFLATHNLATYPTEGATVQPASVSDMRAFIAALEFGKALNRDGFPINVQAAEPGYNNIHAMMAAIDAVFGVEETSHLMSRAFSHEALGAPKHLPGLQGGDNAGLFLLFMFGLQKYMWEGRGPIEQLAYIRQQFKVAPTVLCPTLIYP